MALPQKLNLDMMQNTWASALDPIISNPANNATVLKSVALTTGNNIINHKLGRTLQGWSITRMRSPGATIYDTQDTNQTPKLTLTLNSSANVVVDILVF